MSLHEPPPPEIPGYQIIRTLGGGGMGVVYLARQLSLDRAAAIKVLASGTRISSVELAGRLRREAELMAKLHHPNIVTIFDAGEVDGQPYLAMEFVDGHDLRHWLRPGTPMEVGRVRALVLPLASSLDCLHKNGILHRDLKPENILIGPGDTPKVTDFGVAVDDASAGSLTEVDQWLGTVGYVAPEQQYRLKVDERADQYSMAAVAYEALTGQMPLGVFKPPSRLNPLLNGRVDEVLMRALQEDRDDRFPTILDFGRSLDEALGLPPAARPSGLSKVPRPLAFSLLTMASILCAVALSLRIYREADEDYAAAKSPRGVVKRLGMKFASVPAGEFLMGSGPGDPDASRREMPAHLVKIGRPFGLSIHEVTVRQFRAFVQEKGYRTDAETTKRGGHVYDFERDLLRQDPQFDWRHPTGGEPARDDDPVVQVSYHDAVEFCRWLSDREGKDYRLPTEAEWEYACRAGGKGRWCSGDDVAGIEDFAWTELNSGLVAHPVGRKEPNAFGLHDMHGNAWEWTQDLFAPYGEEPAAGPRDAVATVERVVRGGSFEKGELRQTRSAARRDSPPGYAYFAYGFRVCSPN